jgi:hypothetical protein
VSRMMKGKEMKRYIPLSLSLITQLHLHAWSAYNSGVGRAFRGWMASVHAVELVVVRYCCNCDNFNLAVNLVHSDNGDLFSILHFIAIG